MFGLSSLELRLAGYGLLLAAISGWLIYERAHLIAEGEARITAQDTAARAAQKAEDAKTSAGVVNDLNQKLSSALQPVPVPTLRLCSAPGSVRTIPATGTAQSPVAGTSSASPDRVPAGATGIDIGQPVSDVERAAEVIAIFRDTTWEWAVKQAK